jgi:UDP-N-acetylmuramate--alanine ligase
MSERLKIDKNKGFPKEITVENSKVIHFVGLGGIGMSGLAKFLLELGYKVSGSDIKDSTAMFSISAHGGTVYVGHNAENVEKASLVVVSSAIKTDNPEIVEAMRKNIPIIHRSHVLEALMSGLGRKDKQTSIGVSGTHGKTTTTGMISLVFDDAKLNPSIVVGGQMPFLNTNSKLGSGKYFIAELDESDGSIELYSPDISVITNLEHDHPDHYTGGIDQLLDTFERYIKGLNNDSKIIVSADCPGIERLISRINHPGIILYSIDETNRKAKYIVKNINAEGLKTNAAVYKDGEYIGDLNLGVPGLHNVADALATIAVAMESGLEFKQVAYSLNRFTGMKRRFQLLGTVSGAKIIDDYAHHPTEVQAVLKAAKSVVESRGKGRVVAIFQPHRYSRLANLWNDFKESFKDADVLYVCDIYAACERPIEGISAEKFCKEVNHSNAHYAPGAVDRLPELVNSIIRPDDLVLTIGAGDITKLGYIIIEKEGQGAVTA